MEFVKKCRVYLDISHGLEGREQEHKAETKQQHVRKFFIHFKYYLNYILTKKNVTHLTNN